MVQQIEKFNKYRLANSRISMATGDKLQPITEKESALPDIQSETRCKIPISVGNSPLTKDVGQIMVSGSKRQQPLSPARSQPASARGGNGHLVYVRRRLETESTKTDGHSTIAKKSCPGCSGDPKSQPELVQEVTTRINCEETLPAPNYSTVPTAAPVLAARVSSQSEAQRVTSGVVAQPEPQKNGRHWEERFFRLQMYLKSCDESSQQEYMQHLRSLPAAVRSKHAYELERRAIQLSVEEAKELQRMKFLNVLRKALPDGHSPGTVLRKALPDGHSPGTQIPSLE